MAADEKIDSLASRRFLFVTGKGGVGKTTVCAALALALARAGKRVLIALGGPHERLSAILGTALVGHDIQPLAERIWATRIAPELAVQEYGLMIIKVRAVARAVFESSHTRAFFRAVPGLYDWAVLGKAWYHSTELDGRGRPRFDVVVFDAPSTGHGLGMLRIPKLIGEIAAPGVLRRDADRAWQTFRDPAASGVVVVSLAEDMPATETIELVRALRGELGLPVLRLVVNAVLPPIFDQHERAALLGDGALLQPLPAAGEGSAGGRALRAAARRAAREKLQQLNVERLEREIGLPGARLPFVLGGAGSPEAARLLSESRGAKKNEPPRRQGRQDRIRFCFFLGVLGALAVHLLAWVAGEARAMRLPTQPRFALRRSRTTLRSPWGKAPATRSC
ncbi:MAG: ArsA family ATPase [Deltaproteobacteria bacterium]|nr:ArsA family ATPase [Deltaproteobacteria bacterium]